MVLTIGYKFKHDGFLFYSFITIQISLLHRFYSRVKYIIFDRINLLSNFTATFSKIGYLEIKIFLDKGKVNYSHNSIVQASDLKETVVTGGTTST